MSALLAPALLTHQPDGPLLLHTISGRTSSTRTDPWIERYVFPGSVLPSVTGIAEAVEGLFVLMAWHRWPRGVLGGWRASASSRS